jgi:hypothetical protein
MGWLPLEELWYNTSFHSSLNCSPFKALYAIDPTPGFVPTLKMSDHREVSEMLKERQLFTKLLRDQLAKAQNKMKFFADSNRNECSFVVGDHVLLKLQPHVPHSVVNHPYPKLAYKYFGPYQIYEKIGFEAYKLILTVGSQIHSVFHVSQLKEVIPDYSPVSASLPVSCTGYQRDSA